MTANDHVTAVEALALGEPYAAACAAAEQAIGHDRAAAAAVLFPAAIVPVSADALSAYVFHVQRIPAAGYTDALAALHARAMSTHPDLAALLRGVDAIDDLMAAAASCAVPRDHREPHAAAGGRSAEAARASYQRTIAAQLAADSGHDLAPAARALLAAERLAERLAAARAAHEAHAAREVERAEAERLAAARAVVDKTVERVLAAERKRDADRAAAEQSEREYQRTRAAALVERLRLSGLESLRVGGEVYGAAGLVATVPRMSIEQLARFEAALAAHEAT